MTGPVPKKESPVRSGLRMVSPAAYWVTALVVLAWGLLAILMILRGERFDSPHRALLLILPIPFLLLYIFLIFYVNADAKRRQMNSTVWTLVAGLVPNGIGMLAYFLLRRPLPQPCPSCGVAQAGSHAFCTSCGARLSTTCPSCRQAVESGWKACAHCGARLTESVTPSA